MSYTYGNGGPSTASRMRSPVYQERTVSQESSISNIASEINLSDRNGSEVVPIVADLRSHSELNQFYLEISSSPVANELSSEVYDLATEERDRDGTEQDDGYLDITSHDNMFECADSPIR